MSTLRDTWWQYAAVVVAMVLAVASLIDVDHQRVSVPAPVQEPKG